MSAVSPLNPRVGEWGGGRGVGEERETSFNCSPLSLLTVVWWGVRGRRRRLRLTSLTILVKTFFD